MRRSELFVAVLVGAAMFVGSANTATAVEEPAVEKKAEQGEDAEADKGWHASGFAQYRMLAIADEDPLNDRYVWWRVRAGATVWDKLRVFARAEMFQYFTAEEGESGLLFQDLLLGADYGHELSLGFLGLSNRKLAFHHRAGVFLPTSRASQNQDLYFAPSFLSRVSHDLIGGLSAGVDGWFKYRFHQYAEKAGEQGGMNLQLDFGGQMGLAYELWTHPTFGKVSVGADVLTWYFKNYPSREKYEALSSSQTMWKQKYGWDVYASYTPLPYVTLVVALDHSGSVLRNGMVNTFFVHRDETELAFQLIGRY